ncbi:MAG: cell wall-binding repeat-containing protein, partial [Terriglobia bacterium]
AYKYWDHSSQVEDAPAPILLTDPTRLNPETASEIGRLQARIVVILGGVGAISPAVAASIKKIPGVAEVQRVWGENAPGTAKKIFERMRSAADHNRTPRPDTAIIATQMNFPDALAASSPAAANNMPILLSSQDFIPRETLDALAEGNIEKVIIVGGPAAISTKAELQLKQKGYQVLKRIWGNSEYDTAIAIAKSNGYFSFDYTTVYVARGDWFTDALAGGASASWMIYEDEFGTLLTAPAPIVLVEPGNVPKATQDWLSANRNTVADVYVLGGPGAIADSVSNSISQTLF